MAKKKKQVSRLDAQRAAVQTRVDGWMSLLSGLNTNKDKRTYTTFQAEGTNWMENLELWRGDDLAGRIVEMIPNEMIRQGWKLCIDDDDSASIQKEVTAFLEEMEIDHKLWHALCAERALGGSAIMLGANDLNDVSKPLDLDRVNALTYLEVFEPVELTAYRWQNDPGLKDFGKPIMFRLNPMSPGGSKQTGIPIHASRLAVFPGIRVSRRQVTTQKGWGDAVLSRCRETLRDFQTMWAAAGLLAADFSQAVWKIKGLAEIIAQDKTKEVQNRIAMMELARSIVRATVIDADNEEFERKQTPINGLPELLDRFATRLAASADTPVTLLMGQSPAGLNATGESDIRTFYDRVKSMQVRKLKPVIEKIIKVAFAALDIDEPKDWSIQFNPLWQPSEKEQADARKTQMDTDIGYINASVLSSDIVREQRFSGREYSFNTHVPKGTVVEPTVDPEYEAFKAAQAAKGADVKGATEEGDTKDDPTEDKAAGDKATPPKAKRTDRKDRRSKTTGRSLGKKR